MPFCGKCLALRVIIKPHTAVSADWYCVKSSISGVSVLRADSDSVFVTGEIPESIFKSEYYTVKRPLTPKNRNIAQDRWTNFLHASKKDNFLCGFILDFFLEYWKTQKTLIDYFLIDYAIQIAYDEFPKCRELLDSVPLVNYDLYKFENIMNKEWSVETWNSIKNSTLFSKLAWRKEGKKETLLGKETIYGHIAKNYENQK